MPDYVKIMLISAIVMTLAIVGLLLYLANRPPPRRRRMRGVKPYTCLNFLPSGLAPEPDDPCIVCGELACDHVVFKSPPVDDDYRDKVRSTLR